MPLASSGFVFGEPHDPVVRDVITGTEHGKATDEHSHDGIPASGVHYTIQRADHGVGAEQAGNCGYVAVVHRQAIPRDEFADLRAVFEASQPSFKRIEHSGLPGLGGPKPSPM